MVIRRFSITPSVAWILIFSLFIVLGIGFSQKKSAEHPRVSRISSKKVMTYKPVLPDSQPVNWNLPVNVTISGPDQKFPLSFANGNEYVLIINNLERTTQQAKTVKLTAELDTSNHTITAKCFQNTRILTQRESVKKGVDLFSSPNLSPQPDKALEDAKKERSFFLFVTDGNLTDKNQYTRINGQLIQQTSRIAIYLDDQQQAEQLAPGLVTEITEILENQVLDQITRQCGTIRDVDCSGRFTILLSPWLNKLQGGRTSINGFVRPSDFRLTVPKPFSNHCDMLYLNSTLQPGQDLLDLLTHEVTHAAVASVRSAQTPSEAGSLADEEDWLNEGIAHIMEPGYTNRDYRISEFYRSPESYPLVVSDYYRSHLWRNHGCRGAVNEFLDWCNQIESTQNFPYRFTHHPLTGIEKIEQLTAIPFPELFRQWSLYLVKQSLEGTIQKKSTTPQLGSLCGNFVIAGPALRTWNLFRNPQTSLKISATASGFLHLKSGSQETQNVLIKVNGFEKIQMTLLRIPPSEEQISLTATFVDRNTNTSQSPESFEVCLRCIHPTDSAVKMISLEYSGAHLSRTARRPRKFQTSELNSSLASKSDKLQVAMNDSNSESEQLITDFLIRIPKKKIPKQAQPVYLTFKAIVETENELQFAGQSEIKLPFKPIHRLAKAASSETKVK
ncbi:hypothetical protein V202x_29790 [Gimesia aquarii]|uniref:Neutral metalloprotease n=2 Tax=Gimesia aquarii TaxID=2527964 RepID=A0A517WWI2_9PLAN|nr:hypothetical protein V202x_29790 [Gimesia aquarii]